MFFELKITKLMKSGCRVLEKTWLVFMGTEIFIAVGVLYVELKAYQFSMVSAVN